MSNLQSHTPLLIRPFTDNSLPTGRYNINENTLITPKSYFVEALEGERLLINRLLIQIVDTLNFDATKYGNNITLVNGIYIYIERSDGRVNVLNNIDPIFTNSDWTAYAHDSTLSDYGVGNQSLSTRWSYFKHGRGITLEEGDKLGIRIKDDLRGLIHQHFSAEGMHLQTPNPIWNIPLPF